VTEVQLGPERRTIAPAIGRVSAVLFCISLLLLALYALGSAQSYVDATLLWLLRLAEIALVLTASCALCACCLYAVHVISGRWRFAGVPTVLSLLAAATALALLASLRLVAAVLGGPPRPGLSF
jgi:hypothetical protein